MSMFDMLKQASSMMAVRQVFGEPIERDGVTIIPVARVMGGGGGGAGTGSNDGEQGGGEGGGFGMAAAPAGVYVIQNGQVGSRHWMSTASCWAASSLCSHCC